MRLYLESYDYHIIKTVKTGEEAIKVAKSRKPDLVLMDIKLGGEMDGIEAAKVIETV